MSTRRKRLLLAVVVTLVVLASFALALLHSTHVRHATAKSLRSALGPPAPPALLIEDEPTSALTSQQDAALRVIPHAAPEPLPPLRRPPDLDGVSFVLLLGADNRSDKVTGRTDTMMVAAFRHHDGKVALFSIPRDLWVELPDVGELHEQGRTHARISSVLRVGEVRLGRGQGMPLLRQTLREQLGIRIDRYAAIDFAGFVALIDELGGIDVDVECPLVDCFWQNGTDQPCALVSIPAGRTHMDGATALGFVRSRHGRGDHDRTKRQQALVIAFARELQARGLRQLRGLWARAKPFVRTDLEVEDALYYGSFALENQLGDIHGFAIRHPMIRKHVTEDGKHVLLLDRAAFDRALEQMFDSAARPARSGTRKQCPEADVALTFRDR